jgi:hypothetical protein
MDEQTRYPSGLRCGPHLLPMCNRNLARFHSQHFDRERSEHRPKRRTRHSLRWNYRRHRIAVRRPYTGVAPGAKIIGAGLGAGLFVINGLAAWEWGLANQYRYNIRVVSNSYGRSGAFDPDESITIATKIAHDRNIAVVFAAGNAGPAKARDRRSESRVGDMDHRDTLRAQFGRRRTGVVADSDCCSWASRRKYYATRFILPVIADIQGRPEQAAIEAALKSRLIDTFVDGTFRPNAIVTREELAAC